MTFKDRMRKVRLQVHARYEAVLLRLAVAIVLGRNVARSPVVSRHDNNAMFEMGFKLRDIAKRIETGYPDTSYS